MSKKPAKVTLEVSKAELRTSVAELVVRVGAGPLSISTQLADASDVEVKSVEVV